MEKEQFSITWRVSEEQKARIVEKFGTASGKNVPDAVLNGYFDELPALQAKTNELQKEIEELKEQASNVVTTDNSEVIEALEKENTELKSRLDGVSNYLEALKVEYNRVNSLLEEKVTTIKELSAKADDPNVIAIVVDNPIVRKFLDAVKEHLEEKYERTVSFYEIFVMTTLLYNIEKRCDWFYPPLKDKEIERITGKTVKEWERFFNQKEA